LKTLGQRVAMVELERGEIAAVTALKTSAAHHGDQPRLASSGARNLLGTALMMKVRVPVLAPARAERALPSAKW
jgi:hypothetical protein